MDPETRQKHSRILLGKLFWFQVTFSGIFLYIFYAIFLSGYDCAGEAFVVQEDPRLGFNVKITKNWYHVGLSIQNLL